MIQIFRDIHSISVITQNDLENLYQLHEIEIDTVEIGKGGVGSVFKVLNIDGRSADNLLLKVVNSVDKLQVAYENLKVLHEKINQHQITSKLPIYTEHPELLGLPFLIFKSKDETTGDEVAGFLMFDLNKLGYADFGSDNWDRNKYISQVSFEDKLFLSYQFARGVKFLNDIKYSHSDLKDYSIFINCESALLALIDYDGGFHYDRHSTALTIGAINYWLSSKWRQLIQKGVSSSMVTTAERLDEENWVIANGIFEILFGISPFYFLKDLDNHNSVDKYLEKYKWPEVDSSFEGVNISNLPFHQNLIEIIKSLDHQGLNLIIASLVQVFNQGHSKVSKRLDSKQWTELLNKTMSTLNLSPKIESFISNIQQIKIKGEAVKFTWNVRYANFIKLDGTENRITNVSSILKLFDEKTINLIAIRDSASTSAKIQIGTIKKQPVIDFFIASSNMRTDENPIILKWQVKDCAKVEIVGLVENLDNIFEVKVFPKSKTVYVLRAIGYFDEIITQEVLIDVISPEIDEFRYEVNIEIGIDNIDLIWSTRNAVNVEISPRVGAVGLQGLTHIGIAEKTQFTIRAIGLFDVKEMTIEAQPFPIPIIKSILIPTPIVDIESNLPNKYLQIPNELIEASKVNFIDKHIDGNALTNFVKFKRETVVDLKYHNAKKGTLIQSITVAIGGLYDRILK